MAVNHLLEQMKNTPASQFRRSAVTAISLILVLVCAVLSGCASLSGNEVDRFATGHVRVVHEEKNCKDVDQSAATSLPNADRIESIDFGLGRFTSKVSWEVLAREVATELDADIALIRPCDGESWGFQYAQIEVWRTRGYDPVVQGELYPENGALVAPSSTSYGVRLQNIFECFEQARVTSGSITPESRKRLGNIIATEYFSPGPYFAGWVRIDRHYRPARSGDLSLAMVHADRRFKADWAAGIYQNLSANEKLPFAERYLVCLLDRGYSWRRVDGSNKSFQPTNWALNPIVSLNQN